jgi:hypothetical protein
MCRINLDRKTSAQELGNRTQQFVVRIIHLSAALQNTSEDKAKKNKIIKAGAYI